MVKIRLARCGTSNRPFYHIIVTDSRNPRDGKFIERIGFFNPISTIHDNNSKLNLNRVDYWINHGAKCSKRVCFLIKNSKRSLLT